MLFLDQTNRLTFNVDVIGTAVPPTVRVLIGEAPQFTFDAHNVDGNWEALFDLPKEARTGQTPFKVEVILSGRLFTPISDSVEIGYAAEQTSTLEPVEEPVVTPEVPEVEPAVEAPAPEPVKEPEVIRIIRPASKLMRDVDAVAEKRARPPVMPRPEKRISNENAAKAAEYLKKVLSSSRVERPVVVESPVSALDLLTKAKPLTGLSSIKKTAPKPIIEQKMLKLYRGMSLEDYERIKNSNTYTPNEHNPHNDATTNLETARYYASTKVHDDEGVVIEFKAPEDAVRQDTVTTEDYKVVKPISMTNHRVINPIKVESVKDLLVAAKPLAGLTTVAVKKVQPTPRPAVVMPPPPSSEPIVVESAKNLLTKAKKMGGLAGMTKKKPKKVVPVQELKISIRDIENVASPKEDDENPK